MTDHPPCWAQDEGRKTNRSGLSSFVFHRSSLALSLSLALLLLTAATASAQSPGRGGSIVRIFFKDEAQLNALAARLDIWEVHRDAGYVVAPVSDEIQALLVSQGYTVEIDKQLSERITALAPPAYPCYRTVEQIEAALQATAIRYPSLAQLIDYGDSWEKVTHGAGYDLWLLKLTNQAIPGPKPALFLMADLHARELATVELAMAFVDYLTGGYGTDPDVTWLLDYHEIYVAPMTNPDGHKLAEQGYWQRKNTNHTNGRCNVPPDPWNQYGVDLNRNSSFHWGEDLGSSALACDQTYRGPAVTSEPETQALESYLRTLFPDQRGPADSDPAPDTTTGIFITLHSYGQLVLWPYGHTTTPSPNDRGLRAIGRKFAAYNGYTAGQSSSTLYVTSGATDDFVYGVLGVPGYTFEIGDTFFQPCGDLSGIIASNLPALLYAAKIARTPYQTAFGPDALSLWIQPPADSPIATLTARIDDTQNGGQRIATAEYYIDVPPWTSGIAHPMTALNGSFTSANEWVQASIDASALVSGTHALFVRGQDADGAWGPVTATFLRVCRYPADFDLDSDVDVKDVLDIARRWLARPDNPLYNTRYDFDGNQRIDVFDIQVVASRWGVQCGN